MAEHQSNRRLVRRIEALELRITGAASHDKVQRLSRRVEAVELRFSAGAVPRTDITTGWEGPHADPVSSREEALQMEVESLKVAYRDLEGELKAVQREMKAMVEKMRTLPVAIANVSTRNSCSMLLGGLVHDI